MSRSRFIGLLVGAVGVVLPIHPSVASSVPEGVAQAEPLLERAMKAQKRVRTLTANFIEERKLSLFATSLKSTGRIFVRAPDRLRFEILAPDRVVYLLTPAGLSYRGVSGSAALANGDSLGISKAATDIRSLLCGDLNALRSRYSISQMGEGPAFRAQPKPGVEAPFREITWALSPDLTTVARVTLAEGADTVTELTFSDIRPNAPIPPSVWDARN